MTPKQPSKLELIPGWIKGVLATLTVAAVIALSSFVYNNFTPPKMEAKVASNSALIKTLFQKDSIKSVQDEIIKLKLNIVIANQDKLATEIKADIKDGNDRVNRRLDELLNRKTFGMGLNKAVADN